VVALGRSTVRAVCLAVACLVGAAALSAQVAHAELVGAVEHFPTKCGVEELVAGPDGNVWFRCYREEGTDVKPSGRSVIGRITPLGVVSEFSAGIPPSMGIDGLVAGPEGDLWFTLTAGIGRVTPEGQVTIFTAGLRKRSDPGQIVVGTEGNLWFADTAMPAEIGRVTPQGTITEFKSGLSGALGIGGIVGGPGGNLWFTQVFDLPSVEGESGGTIARVDPSGAVTSFGAAPDAAGAPVLGSDGNVWFANATVPGLDRVTPSGEISRFAPKLLGLGAHLAVGAEGNVWFTQHQTIGRVTPNGEATTFTKCLAYRQDFSEATSIVPGPGGDLWFTSVTSRELPSIEEPATIGRVTPSGGITQFKGGISGEPSTIVAGTDGRVYFAGGGGEQIQRIVPPTAPVNTFVFAGGKSTKGGVATIGVEVPGPGKVEVRALGFWRYSKPDKQFARQATVRSVAPTCGSTQVRLRLPAAALIQLRREREVRVKVLATFTPTGGSPNTELRQTTVRFR
jgi:streptogramin lyase